MNYIQNWWATTTLVAMAVSYVLFWDPSMHGLTKIGLEVFACCFVGLSLVEIRRARSKSKIRDDTMKR